MEIDSMKGGTEGIANLLEMQRMAPVENQIRQQDQNRLSRPESATQGAGQPQTGNAVQGLGENLNLLV